MAKKATVKKKPFPNEVVIYWMDVDNDKFLGVTEKRQEAAELAETETDTRIAVYQLVKVLQPEKKDDPRYVEVEND